MIEQSAHSKTWTALVTPFKTSGELDLEAFEALLGRQLDAGVYGLVVAGTTGEASVLSQNERSELVQLAVSRAQGKARVMVGVGTSCTTQTLSLAQDAYKYGADSVLVACLTTSPTCLV